MWGRVGAAQPGMCSLWLGSTFLSGVCFSCFSLTLWIPDAHQDLLLLFTILLLPVPFFLPNIQQAVVNSS